mgnify:CR=1 FL=1
MYDTSFMKADRSVIYTLPSARITHQVNKNVVHKGYIEPADNSQNAIVLDFGAANDVFTITGTTFRAGHSFNWNGTNIVIPGELELEDMISNWWQDSLIYFVESPTSFYTGVFGNCSVARIGGQPETAEFTINFYARSRNQRDTYAILRYERVRPDDPSTASPSPFTPVSTEVQIISMQIVQDLVSHINTANATIQDATNNLITLFTRDAEGNEFEETTNRYGIGQRIQIVDSNSLNSNDEYTRILFYGKVQEVSQRSSLGGPVLDLKMVDHMAELANINVDELPDSAIVISGLDAKSAIQTLVTEARLGGTFNQAGIKEISINISAINNISPAGHSPVYRDFRDSGMPVMEAIEKIASSDFWITAPATATQGSNVYLDEYGNFILERPFAGYPTDPLNNGLTLVYGEDIDDATTPGRFKTAILEESFIVQSNRGTSNSVAVRGKGNIISVGNTANFIPVSTPEEAFGRANLQIVDTTITNVIHAADVANATLTKVSRPTVRAQVKVYGYPIYRDQFGDFQAVHAGDMVHVRYNKYSIDDAFQVYQLKYHSPSQITELELVREGSGSPFLEYLDRQIISLMKQTKMALFAAMGTGVGLNSDGTVPTGTTPSFATTTAEYNRFVTSYTATFGTAPTTAQLTNTNNLFFYPLSNALLELLPADRLRTFSIERLALFSNSFLLNKLSDMIPSFPDSRLTGTAYIVDSNGSLGFGPQTVSGSGFSLEDLNRVMPDTTAAEQSRRVSLGLPATKTSGGIPLESGALITPNGADNPVPGYFTLLRPIGTQYAISWRFGELDTGFTAATGYDGHHGLDFLISQSGANDGVVSVVAPIAGTITEIAPIDSSSAGIYLAITAGIGSSSITVRLLHLHSISGGLVIGSSVSRGQEIGKAGSTGYITPSTAVVLHMDLTYPNANPDNIPNYGGRVDPEPFLVNS